MAASRMRGFKWLHANIGMPFPITSPIIKDFTRAADGHVSKQAQTLEPGDFVNILRLAKQEGGTTCIPAKLVTLACVTCLRCKHFARSTLQSRTSSMLSAHCAKGKKVRKGARPPYTWALPLMPDMHEDLFDFIVGMLERWHRPPFFVPAFQAGTTRRRFLARK